MRQVRHSGTTLNKTYFKTNSSQAVHKTKANMKSKSISEQLASFQIPNGREVELSAPRPTPPVQKVLTVLTYDKDLFSGTESEATEEEQLDFATPVSSRSETPPPANANDLGHCVTIMQQIAAQDVALLKELTAVREMAGKLRKRARDVRELVKAENGRRERMETYFRYWEEVEPNWDRQWLYGEKVVPNRKESNEPPPVPGRKPVLSPEQLKQRRQEIVSRQEAEQQELEILRRREERGRNFSREEPSEEIDECSKGGVELASAEEDISWGQT